MSASPDPIYQYQPGGSLPPDAPTYVKRQADKYLYQSLVAGKYCYILNARQMGKSSLRIRTMGLLEEQGITCADVELSGIGSQQINASQWYGGVIQELVSGFGLAFKRRAWIQEREDLSPVQQLSQFIETVLLTQITTPIVVFVDEIDSVLGLNFPTDEFFALIRYCYEKRATNADYKRLTFVLLGVATPSDLMRSKQFSPPFNIGLAIPLQGFHIDDCAPLIQGLSPYVNAPKIVLEEILYWSGGQPFLTQKLCWLITQYANDARSPVALGEPIPAVKTVRDWFKAFVHTHIIQHWEASDEPEHLRTIRDRLLREGTSNPQVLLTYREILHIGHIPSRDKAEHLKLRLSGIVDVYQGQLRVKNSIYAAIFNQYWIDQEISNVSETINPTLGTADTSFSPISENTDKLQPEQSLAFPAFRMQPQKQGKYAYLPSLLMGVGMTVVVVAASLLGIFETLELKAFDYLMRSRPSEGSDQRFLLVTITEADVQAQPIAERGAASLSDESLLQLLTILQRGRPRVIGLDVYRQRRVDNRYTALAEYLAKTDQLFGICYYSDPGVPPPPEMGEYQHGFNNVIQDVDGILRRQILAVSSPAPCNNSYSLNWWLATQYLQQEGIEPGIQGNHLKLGTLLLKRIKTNSGGYRGIDASGHQILLNYRATQKIADTVTLQDILSDQFDVELVRDRIVLIGVIAPTFNDHDWFTPYSGGGRNPQRMTGVEVQAHMTSQLISAVLDGRPLLWTWSKPIEALWIGLWITGSILLISRFHSFRYLLCILGIILLFLGGVCWIVICYGGWIPFIPTILGIIGGGVGITMCQMNGTSSANSSEY